MLPLYLPGPAWWYKWDLTLYSACDSVFFPLGLAYILSLILFIRILGVELSRSIYSRHSSIEAKNICPHCSGVCMDTCGCGMVLVGWVGRGIHGAGKSSLTLKWKSCLVADIAKFCGVFWDRGRKMCAMSRSSGGLCWRWGSHVELNCKVLRGYLGTLTRCTWYVLVKE